MTEDDSAIMAGLAMLAKHAPRPPDRPSEVVLRASDIGAAGGPKVVREAVAACVDPGDPEAQSQANEVVAALKDIRPKDHIEGMIAVQVVSLHHAVADSLRRAREAGSLALREIHLSQAGRLSRAFAAAVEALDRHRGKGREQLIRIERVTVASGGQAIVGGVQGR
jgi:hypothetical protein